MSITWNMPIIIIIKLIVYIIWTEEKNFIGYQMADEMICEIVGSYVDNRYTYL